MLKKTITYKNLFTDTQVTEDFYFHLSKADLVEMEVENHAAEYTSKATGEKVKGMRAHLQKISESNDGPAVMQEFKTLLRRSYGKKVGDNFLKSQGAWDEFVGSEAYSELIFELLTDARKAGEFFAGMVPGNFNEQMEAVTKEIEARQHAAEVAERADVVPEVPAAEKVAAALAGSEAISEPDKFDAATPENPLTLTQDEVVEMDGDELRSGLATGRYKLS